MKIDLHLSILFQRKNKMNLRIGQRYLFHYANQTRPEKWFRATYLGFHEYKEYITHVVHKYESPVYEQLHNPIHFIDSKMISHAETLVDVVKDINCVLPDDVLLVIDGFY